MAYSKAYLIYTVAIKGMYPIFLYVKNDLIQLRGNTCASVGFEPTPLIGAFSCFSFQTLLTAPLGHMLSLVETVQ